MAHFALTVDVPAGEAELAASLLWDAGCSGLEVRDAEEALLPQVRRPARGEAILVAGFSAEAEAEAARALLVEGLPTARCVLEACPDVDWSVAWRQRVVSTRVGRLWVGPPWETPPADAVAVHIEPKMAFGTGDHPTTRLCLQALDDYLKAHPEATVLDVGTGTGVLALAAWKLGAAQVVGVDTDSVAVALAEEARAANGAQGVRLSCSPLAEVEGQFDLVLANILANTLIALAEALAARTRDTLVLAGILAPQAQDVAAAFRAVGLCPAGEALDGDWVRLTFRRGP